ncbi:hypothetical protein GGI21_001082 [Coemansia aciculifera]|nr:hypothetical protein GGI21_001082 [Coemansia aciculifera]
MKSAKPEPYELDLCAAAAPVDPASPIVDVNAVASLLSADFSDEINSISTLWTDTDFMASLSAALSDNTDLWASVQATILLEEANMNMNTDAGNTSETDSGNTSETDSGNTSETDSGNTSETEDGNTSETDTTTDTDGADTTDTDGGNTSETEDGNTSEMDSADTDSADTDSTEDSNTEQSSGANSLKLVTSGFVAGAVVCVAAFF